jgi:hypothetical protein
MKDLPDAVLSTELSSGERLLWSGKPRGGIRLRSTDAIAIPFSIMWCGFAIVWETTVTISGAPLLFKLWGIPFVIVGLYIVVGRFFVDALVRKYTFYGVTSERALITTTLFGCRRRSIGLRTLGEIALSERSDESGTITFGSVQPFSAGLWFPGSKKSVPSFEMIDKVESVYSLIIDTQRKLLSA